MIQPDMSSEYDPAVIEPKWQKRWAESGIYETDLDRASRPFYNLMMFPYPSSSGLHVGNVFAFTGADIYGRFKAMQGYAVFEPMGFDAFGIHSENYALKLDIHPRVLVERSTDHFKAQLERLGNRYDWSHSVDTIRPEYYRWNQWLFIQLYKAGLAERQLAPVNWCPSCRTVLADAQVIDDDCERCDTKVESRDLEQWAFKTTRYAERLLKGLDKLDWSEVVKTAQRNWIGRSHDHGQTVYKLRDWTISRQRYWGTPIPVVYCDRCGVQPVPESQLPVLLPETENWKPRGDGKSPLADIPEFINTVCPQCGGYARRETDVMDNFVDSSWYYLRYPSSEFKDRPFDAGRTKKWLPVDMYIGGREHSVLHLLYSRFISMALHDLGIIEFEEPYRRFFAHGLITRNGVKMSKSRPNQVDPDQYFDQYGADTLRLYLMFAGPYEQGGDFSDSGIIGINRFLQRVWNSSLRSEDTAPADNRSRHQTIKKVTDDLEALKFNTAISSLMQYQSHIEGQSRVSRRDIETLLIMLAPLAPHITEEIWERLGKPYSIHTQAWPEYDPEMVKDQYCDMAVQINGKTVTVIRLGISSDQKEVNELALQNEKVARRLHGAVIKSVVYVPGRVINFVV